MSVVHQIVPWMMRSRARADHHRPAPQDSLRRAGRPNQQLRLRRSTVPALLYRSNDSPSSKARTILSNRKVLFGLDGESHASQ
eukprot:5255028-Pyramimonas_sp.AAC.1